MASTFKLLLSFSVFLLFGPCLVRGDESQYPFQASNPKGIEIPKIGLGLWNSKKDDATKAVEYAFSIGYHHLDSAAAYNNEQFVGAGLPSLTAIPRSSYWVTSKLWNDAHQPDLVPIAMNQTLSDLSTPYLDLYLMHWPIAFVPDKSPRIIIDYETSILSTWRAMESLVRANLTRYIGVSNFSPRQLDVILSECEICPFAHELETHPYLQQSDFVRWHHRRNITVIAYSPLANLNPTYKDKHSNIPPILEDPFWVEMAKSKNCSVAQAVLGWNFARNVSVIPKSVHRGRIEENLGAGKVDFSEKEMQRVAEQDKRVRFNDPSKSWGVKLFESLDGGS